VSEHEPVDEVAGDWPVVEGWRVVIVDRVGQELPLMPLFDDHPEAVAFAEQLAAGTTDGCDFEVRKVSSGQ
jgi:hypothetical protein